MFDTGPPFAGLDALTESTLTFEQPLHERVRLLLRMETLIERFRQASLDGRDFDHHHALMVLVDIYSLAGRVDVKRELMGEIERQIANLNRLATQPGVDQERLTLTMQGQRRLLGRLEDQVGALDQRIKGNEFFTSIRQRTALPGGACDFDLPIYHYWLSQPAAAREALLLEWFQPLDTVAEAITQVLTFMRAAGAPRHVTGHDGYYEQSLDTNYAWQLIRVSVAADLQCYPEISAGRQRFTVRFLDPGDFHERPRIVARDIPFQLTCCAI
ncbi:cell division protein ZapD [Thioalkalivibrio nitratireducens]|nr:cell division protein ZapD [Thioalkalivibrio nitratireducens]